MNTREIYDEWAALRGLRCTCPPDCTDLRWGDGPQACDPGCEPCRIMRGHTYHPPPKSKPARGETPPAGEFDDGIDDDPTPLPEDLWSAS